jgi:hypothetical protein
MTERVNGRDMNPMLSALESVLQPILHDADLVQSEHVVLDDMGWLEYRALDGARPFVLSIFCFADERTVTAEAWRPEQVSRAYRDGSLERAADQQQTWRYDDRSNHAELERVIADTVRAWLVGRLQPAC